MKTSIVLTKKTMTERLIENLKEFTFRFYCYFHTLINNRKMYGSVFWSNSDCYIEVGKTGYISKKNLFDLNGDITHISELILSEINPLKLNFSELEITKIQKLAERKNISIKELLLTAIDKFQQTDTVITK